MNSAYMIYQAERTKTGVEQHEIDASNAMLVHFLSWLWRSLAAPLRPLRRAQRRAQRRALLRAQRGTAPAAELPGPTSPVQQVTGAPPASTHLAAAPCD